MDFYHDYSLVSIIILDLFTYIFLNDLVTTILIFRKEWVKYWIADILT